MASQEVARVFLCPSNAGEQGTPLGTAPSPPSSCKPSSHSCGRLGIAHFFLESRTGWSKRHALTAAPQSDEPFLLARTERWSSEALPDNIKLEPIAIALEKLAQRERQSLGAEESGSHGLALLRLMPATLCLLAHSLVGCSKPVESEPGYEAACHGSPLQTAEQRNRAIEDGYVIDRRYDCVNKASYIAVHNARAQGAAARPSESVASRGVARGAPATTSSSMVETWWPALRYGMSLAEVIRAVPDAKPARAPGKLVTGATGLLRLENLPLLGEPLRSPSTS